MYLRLPKCLSTKFIQFCDPNSVAEAALLIFEYCIFAIRVEDIGILNIEDIGKEFL